jgi:hypothetical protein
MLRTKVEVEALAARSKMLMPGQADLFEQLVDERGLLLELRQQL